MGEQQTGVADIQSGRLDEAPALSGAVEAFPTVAAYVFVGAQHHGYIPIVPVAEGYEVPGSDPVEYVDPV